MTGGQIPLLLAGLQELIMGNTLLKCAAADVGIQWAGWALAAAFRTEKFYDLAGESLGSRPRARFFIDRGNFCVKLSEVRGLATKTAELSISAFSECLLIILFPPNSLTLVSCLQNTLSKQGCYEMVS